MGPIPVLIVLCFITFIPGAIVEAEGAQDSKHPQSEQRILEDAFSQVDQALSRNEEDLTLEDEYYLGRAVAANILERYKPCLGDSELTWYLNKICTALALNSSMPVMFNGYHVMILDSTEINAFATAGGHIFITRAFIDMADSEDALAAIIAHEIAHIQLKHGVGVVKGFRLTQDLLAVADHAIDMAAQSNTSRNQNLLFIESVREIVNTMVTNGYSQVQEFEADDWALSFLALAGYAPSSLIGVLRFLERNQSNHPGGFNNTHPSPALRISNAEKALIDYRIPDTRSFRTARFQSIREF